jgi:hypothetical protein
LRGIVWESVAAQQPVVVGQWQDFLCWLAVFLVDGWVMEKKNARPVPCGVLQNLTIFGIWVGGASVVVKARDSNRFAASRFRGFQAGNREGLRRRPDFIGDFAGCRSG